jgi:hypothetical protein
MYAATVSRIVSDSGLSTLRAQPRMSFWRTIDAAHGIVPMSE